MNGQCVRGRRKEVRKKIVLFQLASASLRAISPRRQQA